MFWSKDNTFRKTKIELDILRKNIKAYLHIKERKMSDISDYLTAFDYFVEHPTEFDGATIVKDLVDIGELDLDAMVHDYCFIKYKIKNI